MRILVLAIGVTLAGAGVAAANQATPADAQTSAVGFMGARLGMGLAEWKALTYPGRNPAQVRTLCSEDSIGTAGSRPGPGASAQSGNAVVCTYANRLGKVTLPLSFPLTNAYLVREPKYVFVGGRLARVGFRTSIDAFNDLTARFEARYGPATQTLHDDVTTRSGLDLPRVRKIWRLASGSVEIIDPSTPPTQLAVQFTGR
ncbi:MAG TPA: hypothetical protein VGL73_06110 [Caulobacteraceae bacterium]|jgi:hypothetical protein